MGGDDLVVGFCIGCGYSLRGLSDHRCPECGRAFDPGNGKTFLKTPHGHVARWLARPLGWPVVVLAFVAAGGVMFVMCRECYDSFCPIEVRPQPTEMARVGIILTEFAGGM